MKLYEINEGIAALRDFGADPETGEILDMSDEDIAELVGVLQLDKEEKLENIACLIKELKKESEALEQTKRERVAWYDNRIKAHSRRIESLKNYMEMNMESDEKIKTDRASIFWKKNPSSVQVDINHLPVSYYKIREPEADKIAIKDALLAGKQIPGAWLLEGETHIQIR